MAQEIEMITTNLRGHESEIQETQEHNVWELIPWDQNWHMQESHSQEHSWPHIPWMQGESVIGPITNTSLTTLLFFFIILGVSILANRALNSSKPSRLKNFFLTTVKFFDTYLRDSLWDKAFARKYFTLIVGIFFIILFGNFLGLVIDWIWGAVSPVIFTYLRPMHSDLNTTAVLAAITVIMMIFINIKTHGTTGTLKSYLFNFTGHNFIEKCVSVFVGWLHFIGLWATFASLSLRLFGNIFAGIVLLGVITYLWGWATASFFEVWKLVSIPFWFFEIGVALIQAVVFAGLMIAFFNSAKSQHH